MLKTASKNAHRAGLAARVRLERRLAEEFSGETVFHVDRPFDIVFFSYSLSMIPDWRGAVDRSLDNLKVRGSLWVVDFWDQKDLPDWFAGVLQRWLSLFHVRHRPELLEYFQELERSGRVTLSLQPLYRRYAYLAKMTRIE